MAEFTIAHCRSCKAEIIWTLSDATGKRQPIDAHPEPGANIRVRKMPDGVPRSFVVGATLDMLDPDDDGERRYPHHMTCPQGKEWKRSGEPKNLETPGPKRWRTMHR